MQTSVDLGDLAEDEEVESLRSLVLDFDAEGRRVGIEIHGDAERFCHGISSLRADTTKRVTAAPSEVSPARLGHPRIDPKAIPLEW